jgi:hypothetical protein
VSGTIAQSSDPEVFKTGWPDKHAVTTRRRR